MKVTDVPRRSFIAFGRIRAGLGWLLNAPPRRPVRLTAEAGERRGAATEFALTGESAVHLGEWALARVTLGASSVDRAVSLRAYGGATGLCDARLPAFRDVSPWVLLRLPDNVRRLAVVTRDEGPAPERAEIRQISRLAAFLRIAWDSRHQLGARYKTFRTLGLRRGLGVLVEPYRPRFLDDYEGWIAAFDTPKEEDLAALRARVQREAPLISVVTAAYQTPPSFLRDMIASIRAQTYPYWQLCIADDASPGRDVREIVEAAAAEDGRIRFERREANGRIAAATNTALSKADGAFHAFVDHDDTLAPYALSAMANAVARTPTAALLYSDEDKIDEVGRRYEPFFKPDWDQERILCQNYVNHLSVFRADLVRRVGGLREGFEGAQDLDLLLRVAALGAGPIVHVPHILYHWRLFAGAGTFSSTRMNVAKQSAMCAVREHLAQAGQDADVSLGEGGVLKISRTPMRWPRVSIIVPTRDQADFTRRCAQGVLEETDYPHLELIIADNDSADPETHALFAELGRRDNVRVLPAPGSFNFAKINNDAAAVASGAVLLFLNNDMSVKQPDWLKALVGLAVAPDVGAVGAMLRYPDGAVQHAGIVIGVGGAAGHVDKRAGPQEDGYFSRLRVSQRVSAVTGACLAMRREVFDEIGGFDENLAVAFNDVDLCLRAGAKGYRVLWTPHADVTHWESKSRGADVSGARLARFTEEKQKLLTRWGDPLPEDPWYNPNLDLGAETPRLAFPPRIGRPWA